MEIKLKSALKIPRQQLLLAVRALLFAASLWLLADRDFSLLQLIAFGVIGFVLYLTPVFQTLLLLPSFVVLMIAAPVAMSVFGPQLSSPVFLAGFFGLLFYVIIGIKQVVFAHRIRLHYLLHLALVYCLGLLFFAAPGGDWFAMRSGILLMAFYFLIRELLTVRGVTSAPLLRFTALLLSFLGVQAVWAISLLPIGFINAAGTLLVFLFTSEAIALARFSGSLSRKMVITELATFAVLMLVIFGFSTWALP